MAAVFDLRLRGIRIGDIEPLIASGDLADEDRATPARLGEAIAELFSDMASTYAARAGVAVDASEPISALAVPLPGSRVQVGDAGAVDLEIAANHIRDLARDLAATDEWLRRVRLAVPAGAVVHDCLDAFQLREMQEQAVAAVDAKCRRK